MDFFGNKIKRLLLILGGISLFIWVVWPFLRGGQPTIQTAFMPINTQMEALLVQEANEKKEGKTTVTPKSSSPATSTSTPSPTSTSNSIQNSTKADSKSDQTPNSSGTPTSSSVAASPAPSSISSTSSKAATSSTEAQNGLLDLNTATLEQLDKLPGIGESKAKAIIEYRTKKGRFKRLEELMEVKGIGDKMFEKLKELLFVAPS